MARCRPKSSLDFARLLRAVVQSQDHGWDWFLRTQRFVTDSVAVETLAASFERRLAS